MPSQLIKVASVLLVMINVEALTGIIGLDNVIYTDGLQIIIEASTGIVSFYICRHPHFIQPNKKPKQIFMSLQGHQ